MSLGNLCFLPCLRDSPSPGPTVFCSALAGKTEMVQRGRHNFTWTFPSCPFRTILTFSLQGKTHEGEDMIWISSKPFKLVLAKTMWLNFTAMSPVGVNWRHTRVHVHTKTCTWMSIAEQVTKAKTWKMCKCSPIVKWVSEMWDVLRNRRIPCKYSLLHTRIGMGLRIITVSEESQTSR